MVFGMKAAGEGGIGLLVWEGAHRLLQSLPQSWLHRVRILQADAPDAADGVLAVDAPAVLRVRRVREVREVLRDLDRFKIWNTYVQDPPTP